MSYTIFNLEYPTACLQGYLACRYNKLVLFLCRLYSYERHREFIMILIRFSSPDAPQFEGDEPGDDVDQEFIDHHQLREDVDSGGEFYTEYMTEGDEDCQLLKKVKRNEE